MGKNIIGGHKVRRSTSCHINTVIVITVYQDRSFTYITKTPPAAILLKKAAKIAKGAGDPKRDRVGEVTRQQVEEIAKIKMVDLNANDLDAACKIIEGTARSMGIEVS